MMLWWLLAIGWTIVMAKKEKKEKHSVTMIFGGDISFNGILQHMVVDKDHCTYEESFERLKPHFHATDYVVANLEKVLFQDTWGSLLKKKNVTDISALRALRNAGINCVSLANSRSRDLIDSGLNSSCGRCEKYNIRYFGVSYGKTNHYRQKPLILKKNGVKIGLLGYCTTEECMKDKEVEGPGAALLHLPDAVQQAKELRQAGCDVVIFFMNWEQEYNAMLSSQALLFIKHLLEKVRIDMIVGSHPRVTHGHWIVNETLVVGSLGNLVAPPYMTAALNFEDDYRNTTEKMLLPTYENLWYKQMNKMNDPSRYGKLLKVTIDKDGIIPGASRYLTTRILATNKHCMVVVKTSKWTPVCKNRDPECIGSSRCNYLECENKYPLPRAMGGRDD